ncbi:MAG: ribosome maturation factor RimM [Candidatus Thiodiazotropha sp. (ex Myrtea sp. 'scaly one' KF741663)]|nr:ribosome maturation factor RimM [Candidatus Thiodiazotropha sp. (ex Myrtea sp. 'scaly one' KF741663)]
MSNNEMIIIGRISGLFGVRGWLKVFSHTSPREGILDYKTWYLKKAEGWQAHTLAAGQKQGKSVVAHFKGCNDRDQAAELVGIDIAVSREQLPKLKPGEYYWTDLEGLRVENMQGIDFGVVSHLLETGANDVLVVKGDDRERLIPYTMGEAVQEVDLSSGRMVVDWDPDF